jgi:hypothetical protein
MQEKLVNGVLARPIEFGEGKYWITVEGNLYKVPNTKRKNWLKLDGEINHGYVRYRLGHKGEVKRLRCHRLVAEAFLPNIQKKPAVNHINGNKQDNNLCNLEWVTHSENEKHSYESLGKTSHNKLPDEYKQAALLMRGMSFMINDIASTLGVSKSFVKTACRGRNQ